MFALWILEGYFFSDLILFSILSQLALMAWEFSLNVPWSCNIQVHGYSKYHFIIDDLKMYLWNTMPSAPTKSEKSNFSMRVKVKVTRSWEHGWSIICPLFTTFMTIFSSLALYLAYYTPRNEVRGGILESPCPSVRLSGRILVSGA